MPEKYLRHSNTKCSSCVADVVHLTGILTLEVREFLIARPFQVLIIMDNIVRPAAYHAVMFLGFFLFVADTLVARIR